MKRIRTVLLVVSIFFALTTVGLLCLYFASQATPEFYAEVLPLESKEADEWGKQLERSIVELQNDIEEGERWQLELQDQQINGWLTSDLPEKFPGTLPADLLEPRVVFQDGQVLVACRLKTAFMSTVLSLVLEPFLTDDAGQFAIRIRRLRAGRVPLPMKSTLERISAGSARAQVPLRWSHDEGDPVAVIRLPDDAGRPPRRVEIDTLEIRDGRLTARGRFVN